jgi:hypothetical protein
MPKADLPRAFAHSVTPNYYHTMEIPLLEGRDFDARDRRVQSLPRLGAS